MTAGVTPSQSAVADVIKLIREASSFVICIPAQSPLDVVAAALALAGAIRQEGKLASLVASAGVDPSISLVGVEGFSHEFGAEGNVIKVSVPYEGKGIENVSYTIDEGMLNVIITPESSVKKIQTSDVQFAYIGGKVDAIITLYIPGLTALGDVYEYNKEVFQAVPVVNIDTHASNSQFGTINLLDPQSSSMSQLVNEILRELKTHISEDTANNLYEALVAATKNFTSAGVNAKTFRMAAFLMEHMPGGAKSVKQPLSHTDGVAVAGEEVSEAKEPEVEEIKPEEKPAQPVGFSPAPPVATMSQPGSPLKPQIF